jgi:ribonuclease P protein component
MERSLRLRKDYDVRAARSGGRSYPDGPLVAKIRPNGLDPAQNRYTAVASKKVGKAHDRNRCKRLVREALRHLHPRIAPGHDVVIVIRGGVAELTGYPVAHQALERIFTRAKLLAPAPPPPDPAVAGSEPPPSPAPAIGHAAEQTSAPKVGEPNVDSRPTAADPAPSPVPAADPA